MPSVEIFIPILPKAQMRDRLTTIKGHARSYKDKKQRIREENLRELLYPRLPGHVLWPLKTPVALTMEVHFPVPKGTSKKKTEAMLSGEIRHDKKPDLDNLEKHLLDCCNGVLWVDDRQIYHVNKQKLYSMTPGWHIVVEW